MGGARRAGELRHVAPEHLLRWLPMSATCLRRLSLLARAQRSRMPAQCMHRQTACITYADSAMQRQRHTMKVARSPESRERECMLRAASPYVSGTAAHEGRKASCEGAA